MSGLLLRLVSMKVSARRSSEFSCSTKSRFLPFKRGSPQGQSESRSGGGPCGARCLARVQVDEGGAAKMA